MTSHEKEMTKSYQEGEVSDTLDISTLVYFWQSGPSLFSKKDNIPKFLRGHIVFRNFHDEELRILGSFFHERIFDDQEIIFNQFDPGLGFYLIYEGNVDLWARGSASGISTEKFSDMRHVILLDKGDYFGELALLQENNYRPATATSKGKSTLLAIYRPDLEDLISSRPTVAAKLLQSLSSISAERVCHLTKELSRLNKKIQQLEAGNEIKK